MTPRSQLIEKSLGCLNFGIASMIPAIGFFLAPLALGRFRFVIVNTNDRWNPARFQLYFGAVLAVASILLHALAGFFIYIQIVRTYLNF
jgi:hypothetical protein